MASSGSGVAMACLVLAMSCMVVPSRQVVFTVGESTGWIPGVDYNAWAKGKNFKVGDRLGECSIPITLLYITKLFILLSSLHPLIKQLTKGVTFFSHHHSLFLLKTKTITQFHIIN